MKPIDGDTHQIVWFTMPASLGAKVAVEIMTVLFGRGSDSTDFDDALREMARHQWHDEETFRFGVRPEYLGILAHQIFLMDGNPAQVEALEAKLHDLAAKFVPACEIK